MRIHFHTYACRIYTYDLPDRYVTLTIWAVSLPYELERRKEAVGKPRSAHLVAAEVESVTTELAVPVFKRTEDLKTKVRKNL